MSTTSASCCSSRRRAPPPRDIPPPARAPPRALVVSSRSSPAHAPLGTHRERRCGGHGRVRPGAHADQRYWAARGRRCRARRSAQSASGAGITTRLSARARRIRPSAGAVATSSSRISHPRSRSAPISTRVAWAPGLHFSNGAQLIPPPRGCPWEEGEAQALPFGLTRGRIAAAIACSFSGCVLSVDIFQPLEPPPQSVAQLEACQSRTRNNIHDSS